MIKSSKHCILPTLVAISVAGWVVWVALYRCDRRRRQQMADVALNVISSARSESVGNTDIVSRLDEHFAASWREQEIKPADPAADLAVLRRLSISLVGSVPSLAEIREFESDAANPNRLLDWTDRYLRDSRFAEFLGARMADVFVDPAAEALKPHQRERFRHWMGQSIRQETSFSEIVGALVAGQGGLADHPEATFVALDLSLGDGAPERLAARTSRALLGQRIDCAQCHDHPFADWTQDQFEGLAAYYGHVRFRRARVQDTGSGPLRIEDDRAGEQREVDAQVPFAPDWAQPESKHLRLALADWITHPGNRRFRRAIANRIWQRMFGRALLMPVDDLPDPGNPAEPDTLDLLAGELANHNDNVCHLIRVIVATRVFQLDSRHSRLNDPEMATRLEDAWAVFPLTELGPHQLVRSMQQSASAMPLAREDSNWYTGIRRYEQRTRFVNDYGLASDTDEIAASTIPHIVQRISGSYTRRYSNASLLTAAGRIAVFSRDPNMCVENCFLACLSRRPTSEEQAHFVPQFSGGRGQRSRKVEDLYWTLFNSTEFCWNH